MGRDRDPLLLPGVTPGPWSGGRWWCQPQDGLARGRPIVHPREGRPRAGGRAPGALCKPVGFGPGRIWRFFSHSFHFLAFGTAPQALGALPLRCLAPAGPSRPGRPGVSGHWGSAGLEAGRPGSLPTVDRSLGMVTRGWQMVAKQSPSPRPAAPPGLGHGQVHTAAAAWVAAPSPEGWASQPPRVAGLRASVCAALPSRACFRWRPRAPALRPQVLGSPHLACPT